MKRELNITARDKVVWQITTLMDKLRAKGAKIETALDHLEHARNSAYTAPMPEVKETLMEARRSLKFGMSQHVDSIGNLANVSNQIAIGEFDENKD